MKQAIRAQLTWKWKRRRSVQETNQRPTFQPSPPSENAPEKSTAFLRASAWPCFLKILNKLPRMSTQRYFIQMIHITSHATKSLPDLQNFLANNHATKAQMLPAALMQLGRAPSRKDWAAPLSVQCELQPLPQLVDIERGCKTQTPNKEASCCPKYIAVSDAWYCLDCWTSYTEAKQGLIDTWTF